MTQVVQVLPKRTAGLVPEGAPRRAAALRALAGLALAAVALTPGYGCSPGTAPPEGPPAVLGTVTDLRRGPGGDVLGSMLVEGRVEGGTQFDKASVTVTSKTRVLRRRGDDYAEASFDDVREGATVGVWITGPVRESYPVQADAATVVLEE